MSETTTVSEQQTEQQTEERDCMHCEQTFSTTAAENADYCEKCQPRKWTTSAGPIQAKRVRGAIGKVSQEGQTYDEIIGIKGVSESRHAFWSPFSPARAETAQALRKIGLRFGYSVTRDNYIQVIEACMAAVAELKKTRPVKDETRTPEQDAEITRKIREREERDRTEADGREQAKRQREEELRASQPVTSAFGVTVRYNSEHDGVEISFPSKPERSKIDECKSAGFRWSVRNKVWYHKFDERAWSSAHRVAGLETAPGPAQRRSNPDGSYVQAQEDAYQDNVAAAIGA